MVNCIAKNLPRAGGDVKPIRPCGPIVKTIFQQPCRITGARHFRAFEKRASKLLHKFSHRNGEQAAPGWITVGQAGRTFRREIVAVRVPTTRRCRFPEWYSSSA